MYHTIDNRFFEVVNSTVLEGRLGHSITIGANPVMRIYPQDAYRYFIDFPVFV